MVTRVKFKVSGSFFIIAPLRELIFIFFYEVVKRFSLIVMSKIHEWDM